MLKRFVQVIGGDPNKREIEKYSQIVEKINNLEAVFESLSEADLRDKTVEFKRRLEAGETLDDILAEAFATVREASKRTIGLRHYDVQLIGGLALHHGIIAEMRTGEGKTLVATLPLYLNALTGKGTHLVTVNDYLARRDARWMAPIYQLLDMRVGVLQMASRTESGKKAFLVDLERHSPHEDQDQLIMVPRSDAYKADITYGTNSEFGFDFLRDNMAMNLDDRVQRGHHFAIIDEVDNVLIDEARTPLIISGPAQDEAEWYVRMSQVVRQLNPEDYEISEKDRNVTLTEIGEGHVEAIMGVALRDPERPEDLTMDQARLIGYLEQALRAEFLYKRNKEYLVQSRKVIIVDEFTGRMMPGRRWSDGLHQAIEAKEGVPVQPESITYATITIQNYFRMYEKLSGMTGTAVTEAEEFDKIYKLNVLAIPTNLEYEAEKESSGLTVLVDRDQLGYKYTYYARSDDPDATPVFWKRKDYPDVVYRTAEVKLRVIAQEILRDHILGRPVLVGTTSVELSERVAGRLKAEPLRRLALVLLLRNAWLIQNNHVEDGRQIPELMFLYENLEDLDISVLRKLARELDVHFNPENENNLTSLKDILDISENHFDRLTSDLRGGIPHQVLNARKHTEESKIIAEAGEFGAVTIATNMAGRGVDIKLGGELREEVVSNVNRVLQRNGHNNAYTMTMEERHTALSTLEPSQFGVYSDQINAFFDHMNKMALVKELGGLHVIGSERHEARRIDNQLRGRSARQGDPGLSRFYLSMEDDLMRLFGGQQADALMQRMKIDDAMPMEVGLVSRLVEQAQTRVEGANFDIRKHLLEYDDVLNAQRASIYGQRDRIFTKDDLTDDVTEMLQDEVTYRVPQALQDEGGPWRLLAWLDQIQPPLQVNGSIFPSFTLRLILDNALDLSLQPDASSVRGAFLRLARQSLEAERDHHLLSINKIIELAEDRFQDQLEENLEMVDQYFEGIVLSIEDDTASHKPTEMLEELSNTLRINFRLTSEEMRIFREDPSEVKERVEDLVTQTITERAIIRLLGAVERRLNESLDLDLKSVILNDWDQISQIILESTERTFSQRIQRLISNGGGIERDLDNALARDDIPMDKQRLLHLILMLPQGSRAVFDKKTHKRILVPISRLNYLYYAAQFIENRDPEDVAEEVLNHLEEAQEAICRDWGRAEYSRVENRTISELEPPLQEAITHSLSDMDSEYFSKKISSLPNEIKSYLRNQLGLRALTGIYRQLLLSVITQLWVDYLTQMEALRISIGLEAYAQRDPLVQYKSRASELFNNLLSSMRLEVISRMFTFRPRNLSRVHTPQSHEEEKEIPIAIQETESTLRNEGAPPPPQSQELDSNQPKKKKRRRRRR